MRTAAPRRPVRRAHVVIAVLGLAGLVLAACGSQPASPRATGGMPVDPFIARAQQVAQTWRDSGLLTSWTTGFVPFSPLTLEPVGGYASNENLKAAYGNGYVKSAVTLPVEAGKGEITYADGSRQPVGLVSAQSAYTAMVPPQQGTCPPKPGTTTCDWAIVSKVEPGTTTILTSRGEATVPTWKFTVIGLREPIVRVAVDPTDISAMPELPPIDGRGSWTGATSVEGWQAIKGTSVTLALGLGACDKDPRGLVWENDDVVVVGGSVTPPDPGTACTAQLIITPVTVTTKAPVGTRPILDVLSGRALLKSYAPD